MNKGGRMTKFYIAISIVLLGAIFGVAQSSEKKYTPINTAIKISFEGLYEECHNLSADETQCEILSEMQELQYDDIDASIYNTYEGNKKVFEAATKGDAAKISFKFDLPSLIKNLSESSGAISVEDLMNAGFYITAPVSLKNISVSKQVETGYAANKLIRMKIAVGADNSDIYLHNLGNKYKEIRSFKAIVETTLQ